VSVLEPFITDAYNILLCGRSVLTLPGKNRLSRSLSDPEEGTSQAQSASTVRQLKKHREGKKPV
jgi:hypothetical protein